jgi:hypothetical protein
MERFLRNLTSAVFLFAAISSLAAGTWLLFTPYSVQSMTTTGSPAGAAVVTESMEQVSFYQLQGAWGLFVLVVFTLLYSSGFIFYRSDHPWLAALSSGLALALTGLSGFSIGPAYLPAAVAAMIGLSLILFHAILPPSSAGLS